MFVVVSFTSAATAGAAFSTRAHSHSHIDFSIFLASIHSFSGIMYWEMSEYYLFINKICKRGHLSYAWIGSGSSQSMWTWLWHERKRREWKTCNSTTCACSNFKLHCEFCDFLRDKWKLIYTNTDPRQFAIHIARTIHGSDFTISIALRESTHFRIQRCLTYWLLGSVFVSFPVDLTRRLTN